MKYKACLLATGIFVLNLLALPNLFAADDKYPVNSIPENLRKSANAVIRNETLVFDLKSIEKATLKQEYAITIFNKNALYKSYFIRPYDQFSKIKSLSGALYDADGKLVKKFKQEDIRDFSANGGGSVFIDNRVKVIDPEYLKYPFTVEYSFEVDFNGLLNYPDWQIYEDYNISIEKSSFTVKQSQDMKVRIRELNIDFEASRTNADGEVWISWKIENKPAIVEEPFSDELEKISPAVLLAPSNFLIDGYEGNCESWENFGKWIYELNQGRSEFPETTKQKISELTKDANSDYEKASILYHYLQDNTRYVSVQVGIGSWQPMEAEDVDKYSYGDCKALTNYMQALLNEANIPSYYTLVRAGRNSTEIFSDFPSNQFNHAILCALIDNDTVWLECTSQRLPFGYIGSFTDDRDVVIINEEGGKLVKTKTYTCNENQKNCTASIQVDDEGNLMSSVFTEFKGVFYDENLQILLSDDHDKEKLIREKLHLPNFYLEKYTLDENHEMIPSININMDLVVDGYGKKFGNRMAINLNLLNKLEKIPSSKEIRNSEIVARRSFVENDTVIYTIPEGYEVEKASANRSVQSEFGEFESTISVEGSNIQYVRYLKINKGIYPPDHYEQFAEFYNAVKHGDEDRV
ncbi:MAG TPA: DUF3857 domain-containing protein, partial [Bacteroidales bacterium]